MALRNQPYIPLYVQDFLTDEKLMECSAEATGVYIRLLCIMHKSEDYGTLLLKQKYKQTNKHIENFACQLAKPMPYSEEVIHRSLHELINEGVISIETTENRCKLLQNRMIRDNNISLKRSEAGSKGGKNTQFASSFAKAKVKANTESEYENENVRDKELINIICEKELGKLAKVDTIKKVLVQIDPKMRWTVSKYLNKRYPEDGEKAFKKALKEVNV